MSTDPESLIRCARAVCRRAGFDMDDGEYESAVGLAVTLALQGWTEAMKLSLSTYASRLALRECRRVRREDAARLRQIDRSKDVDEVAAPVVEAVEETAGQRRKRVSQENYDRTILNFTAEHGIASAAQQLEMSEARLRSIVNEIGSRHGKKTRTRPRLADTLDMPLNTPPASRPAS